MTQPTGGPQKYFKIFLRFPIFFYKFNNYMMHSFFMKKKFFLNMLKFDCILRQMFFFEELNFQRVLATQVGIGRSWIDRFGVCLISYLRVHNHFGHNLMISKIPEMRVHEHIWPHCGALTKESALIFHKYQKYHNIKTMVFKISTASLSKWVNTKFFTNIKTIITSTP